MTILPGDVYWVSLKEQDGSARRVIHPHVVVQNNSLGGEINTVIVCGVTTNLKRAKAPGNVLLEAGEANLPRRSVVVVSQVAVVDETQLGDYIGSLSQGRLHQIITGMRFLQSMVGSRAPGQTEE